MTSYCTFYKLTWHFDCHLIRGVTFYPSLTNTTPLNTTVWVLPSGSPANQSNVSVSAVIFSEHQQITSQNRLTWTKGTSGTSKTAVIKLREKLSSTASQVNWKVILFAVPLKFCDKNEKMYISVGLFCLQLFVLVLFKVLLSGWWWMTNWLAVVWDFSKCSANPVSLRTSFVAWRYVFKMTVCLWFSILHILRLNLAILLCIFWMFGVVLASVLVWSGAGLWCQRWRYQFGRCS